MRAAPLLMTILVLTACGVRSAVHDATSAPTIAAAAPRPSVIGRVLDRGKPQTSEPAPDAEWTAATLEALNAEGVTLLSSMPSDVLQYCPGYATAGPDKRAAFWSGMIGLATGTDGAGAAGRKGRGLGLIHVSNPLARQHACSGSMGDGKDALRCAVRILSRSVARDNAIAAQDTSGKRGWLGAARDWLPLRSPERRADIARFTRSQSYCR